MSSKQRRSHEPRNNARALAAWRVGERYDSLADVSIDELLEEVEQKRREIIREREGDQ